MKRKLAAILAAIAIGVTGAVVGNTPAMAAMQGPAGYITFWDGAPVGYLGAAWPIPPQATGTCHSVPSGSNDKFTAFSNNTTHNIRVYTNAGCGAGGGSNAILYSKTETGQMGSPFNNSISSYVWIS